MNAFALNFDAAAVPPLEDIVALPAGDYTVMIVGSAMKPTKDGSGQFLELELKVVDGEYAGRKLRDRLNLANANQTAVELAYKRLSSICRAVGIMRLETNTQLHGLPMLAKVGVRKGEVGGDGKTYSDSNDVKNYHPLNAAAPTPGATPWGGNVPAAAPAPVAAVPTAAPVVAAAAQPWAQPAAPAPVTPPAPVPAPVAPAAPVWPPAGWTAHPEASGYYYKGQEVLTEAQLRERTTPAAPAPVAPAAPTAPVAAPVADGGVPPWAR